MVLVALLALLAGCSGGGGGSSGGGGDFVRYDMSAIALNAGGPEAEKLGQSRGYPAGPPETYLTDDDGRVWFMTHADEVYPSFTIQKSAIPSELPRAAGQWAWPGLRYRFQGRMQTIDDFLARQRIMGLLIIQDGKILVERYQYGRKPTDRFVSFSMAKSITSMLVGAALQDGKLSLDDKVTQYVPELAG